MPGEPLAWLNGNLIPFREASLPVWDLGIVQAVTVTEMLRTFHKQLFAVPEHLERLDQSLKAVGIQPEQPRSELEQVLHQVCQANASLLPDSGELMLNIFVTAGESRALSAGFSSRPGRPTVCVTTRPLDLASIGRQYKKGLTLRVPSIRQIPKASLDPAIKTRNRLHWYLADQEVHAIDPAAEALLLDERGFVTETAKGNLLALSGSTVLTPSAETTLRGISQEVVSRLLPDVGLTIERANLTVERVQQADEVWISGTSACLTPVTRLNGVPISQGVPGPVFRTVLNAWSDLVGVDIVGQADQALSAATGTC